MHAHSSCLHLLIMPRIAPHQTNHAIEQTLSARSHSHSLDDAQAPQAQNQRSVPVSEHQEASEKGEANPCIRCGACCAYFRVSFYWSETDAHPDGCVPAALTEPISAHHVAMRGTNCALKRCVALSGEVGTEVACSIYELRANPCREFTAGDERCNRARAQWGLAPI